jgi:hypothetical protein
MRFTGTRLGGVQIRAEDVTKPIPTRTRKERREVRIVE